MLTAIAAHIVSESVAEDLHRAATEVSAANTDPDRSGSFACWLKFWLAKDRPC